MAYGDFITWRIATGADDWDDSSSTATTITAINNTLVVPFLNQRAYMRFDTEKEIFSRHPRAVIESLEINWSVNSTTVSRRHPSPEVELSIYTPWANTDDYKEIYSYNPVSEGVGWLKTAITNNNNSGYTQFKWEVQGIRGHTCSTSIRAYEWGVGHLSAGYVDIYYHIPQEKKSRIRRIWSKP